MALAVAVVGHGEPGRGLSVTLFLLEGSCFVGVGELGSGDLEDPATQDPASLGVVVGRLGQAVLLRLLVRLR